MESFTQRTQRHEGKKTVNGRHMPYKDSLGLLTLGYGRCIEKIGISEEEACYLFLNDLESAKAQAAQSFPWISGLSQLRREVVCEMVFQMGVARVQGFKNAIAAMQAGNFEKAAAEMLDSAWAKQTPARAEELADIMKTGLAKR